MRLLSRRAAEASTAHTTGMQIPDDQLDDFITTWEHAFNERLTRDDARAKATELLELFSLLARRPPEEESTASPAGEAQ